MRAWSSIKAKLEKRKKKHRSWGPGWMITLEPAGTSTNGNVVYRYGVKVFKDEKEADK